MHATLSLSALVVALSALSAHVAAFHVESGTACSAVGVSCSYISDDSSAGGSAKTTVTGTCGSDLLCASNGATCDSDDQCYNYCGTDGICGGQGAGCNSQADFSAGQAGISCTGDYTCSVNGSVGQCLPSSEVKIVSVSATVAATATVEASTPDASGKARRRHRRRSAQVQARQVRAADLRKRAY